MNHPYFPAVTSPSHSNIRSMSLGALDRTNNSARRLRVEAPYRAHVEANQ
jgi:hypothetical protein